MKCHGCNKAGHGACLGCQAPSCPQSFHALCAIRNGCYVRLVGYSATPCEVDCTKSFTSKRTGDRRKRIFFCPSHVHLSSPEGLKLNESASIDNDDTLQTSKSEPDISLLSTADHDSQTSVSKPSSKKAKVVKRLRKNSQPNNSAASGCDPLLYLNAPINIPNLSQERSATFVNRCRVNSLRNLLPVRARLSCWKRKLLTMLMLYSNLILPNHCRAIPLVNSFVKLFIILLLTAW